jgi:hypothetical protein
MTRQRPRLFRTLTPLIATLIATLTATLTLTVFGLASLAHAYPKPSPYLISWQLKFDHRLPQRIVVTTPGELTATAYWYIRYAVMNPSQDQQNFLPVFEMLSDDGRVVRSDQAIPENVIKEIRMREKNRDLLSVDQMAGPLRIGIDQAKEGIAVWKEPQVRMGHFTIFAAGLSGEATILKDDKGEDVIRKDADGNPMKDPAGKPLPVVLWKTWMMEYRMLGDESYPGNDPLELLHEEWIMR